MLFFLLFLFRGGDSDLLPTLLFLLRLLQLLLRLREYERDFERDLSFFSGFLLLLSLLLLLITTPPSFALLLAIFSSALDELLLDEGGGTGGDGAPGEVGLLSKRSPNRLEGGDGVSFFFCFSGFSLALGDRDRDGLLLAEPLPWITRGGLLCLSLPFLARRFLSRLPDLERDREEKLPLLPLLLDDELELLLCRLLARRDLPLPRPRLEFDEDDELLKLDRLLPEDELLPLELLELLDLLRPLLLRFLFLSPPSSSLRFNLASFLS